MRLQSVDITNYRVIKHAGITLPDQMIGIIGPNGSGKSSIVEAISWALYGHQVARSGKEEIKAAFAAPSDPCSVELAFELKGESFRLIRRLVGKSERAEVELYRAGASESIGIAETRGYIETLLGLDWRGFLTSFLARQQELNALTDLQPSKRREHLAGMLGIERVDRAIAAAKESSRQMAEKLRLLQEQAGSRESLAQRLAMLREQVAQHDNAVVAAAGAQEETARILAEKTTLLREQQERKDACSRSENELAAMALSEAMLDESRAKLAAELNALSADQTGLPALESEVARLAETRDELNRLRQLQHTESLRTQTKLQLESAQRDLVTCTDQLSRTADQLAQVDHQLGELPPDILRQLEQARTELSAIRDRSVQLTTQRDQLNSVVRKLAKQAESLSELDSEPICDRCLRPLSAHDLDQVRQHLSDELAAVRAEHDQLEQQMTGLAQMRQSAESRITELERLAKAATDLTGQKLKLESEQESLTQKKAAAESQLWFAGNQLAQLGDGAFDPARFSQVQTELARLEQVEAKVQQVRGRLQRQPQVESDLAETDRKLAELRTEMAGVRDTIAKIGFDPTALEQATQNWQAAQSAFESAKENLLKTSHARDMANQEIQFAEQQLEQFAKTAQEIEQSRTQQFRSETLARLLAEFKKHLIARIRPRLAELTGQLLADMTDGRYSLVSLDEEYQIQLNDLGQFYGIDRFSGGETDLANLCLRLAISQALTESAGMERSFVMLDEVFGSQDESRRDLVVQGLMSLRRHFPQMILITHFEELKQKVETLVELVPTSHGWSEVRVNGALA